MSPTHFRPSSRYFGAAMLFDLEEETSGGFLGDLFIHVVSFEQERHCFHINNHSARDYWTVEMLDRIPTDQRGADDCSRRQQRRRRLKLFQG
jgi:hypothetical protein